MLLSDNGRYLGGRSKKNTPRGTWRPGCRMGATGPIDSRPCHPETDGKMGRLHDSIEKEIHHYEPVCIRGAITSASCTGRWISTDVRGPGWRSREATKAIRKSDTKWMERDIN